MKKKSKKNKHSKVVATRVGTRTEEKLYKRAEREGILGPRQIAVGTVYNPRNECYQTFVSLTGQDVTHLSAHKEKDSAEAAVSRIKQSFTSQDIYDSDAVEKMIHQIVESGDQEPDILPDEIIRKITYDIRHFLV